MKSKDSKAGRTAQPLSPEKMAELLASSAKAAAAGFEAARIGKAKVAAARADAKGPEAKILRGELQVWNALFRAQRDGTDPMQQIRAEAASKAASMKNKAERDFVANAWATREDKAQNKASFARMVAHEVKRRFGIAVTPDRIARYWLPKQ